jgi:ParB family transcriptional regulator, chromosome partitioning protein
MTALANPMVEIDKIEIKEGFNARKEMDRGALERLAASIERHELVQPIAVRELTSGRFVVVAGHRRLAAAKLAGEKKIAVAIRTGKGSDRAASLIENLQRACRS